MKLLRQRPPEQPEDAAIWWATRRQADPAGFAQDDDAFAAWLADETNAKAWQAMDARIALIGEFATMPRIREMRSAALEATRNRRQSAGRRRLVGAALAASFLGALLWVSAPALGPNTPAATVTENVQRYETAVGQRRDVILSDGSRVTLNTASLIEVRYSAERRDVKLLAGQALFQVAKNPDRPFVVSARDRQVTALGTAFDVWLQGDGRLQVLLVEGHVRVDPVRPKGIARLVPALARTDLTAGEQLLADASGDADVVAADVERDTAWNRGVLIFRNDSVGDAVREVNRYSQVPIVVDDPRVASLKISGIFPTASREDFVAALEALYPVRSEVEQGGTVRLGWRNAGRAREEKE